MARPAPRRSRRLAALALAGSLLAGCTDPPLLQETIAGAPLSLWAAGTGVASYAVLQRGVFDTIYSLVTGKDCSVLNIERRGEYCRSEPVAEPIAFCTRTIGAVDCWTVANPYGPQRAVTDIPSPPAARQPVRWNLSPF
jgi:hypothetical protein